MKMHGGGRRGIGNRVVATLGVTFVLLCAAGTVVGAAVASSAQPASWTIATSPSPAGMATNQLNAVSCPSAGTCVAVGASSATNGSSTLIETLQSNAWSLATPPDGPGSDMNILESISCSSATFCVAVGYYQQKGGPSRLSSRLFPGGHGPSRLARTTALATTSSTVSPAQRRAPAWPSATTRVAVPPESWSRLSLEAPGS